MNHSYNLMRVFSPQPHILVILKQCSYLTVSVGQESGTAQLVFSAQSLKLRVSAGCILICSSREESFSRHIKLLEVKFIGDCLIEISVSLTVIIGCCCQPLEVLHIPSHVVLSIFKVSNSS